MAQSNIAFLVDDAVLERANRVAQAGGNDLNGLILSALKSLAELDVENFDVSKLPPITRAALGMARGVHITDERAAIEEALEEKYGLR